MHDEASLWQLIPLPELRRPPTPTHDAVRTSWTRFWKRRGDKSDATPAMGSDGELNALDARTLEAVAPTPDWERAARALDASLTAARVTLLVGAPGSGVDPVLQSWTKLRSAEEVPEPSPEEILSGGEEWIANLSFPERKVLVVRRLERCCLRHHDGLDLLRRLLDVVTESDGTWIVSCGSWAWAYLQKAVQIEAFLSSPLTLARFDGERLVTWFSSLAENAAPVRVRDAATGRTLLEIGSSEETETSLDSLHKLARASEGLPVVAWEMWRRSLLSRAEGAVDGEDDPDAVWFRSAVPAPPEGLDLDEVILLHALLLHSGLSEEMLIRSTPMGRSHARVGLERLERLHLARCEGDVWHIPLERYTLVRAIVEREGFLIEEQ